MQHPRPWLAVSLTALAASFNLAGAVTVPLGPPTSHRGDAWPSPLRTLWVDRCGRGTIGACGSVACSDANDGTNPNAPLCTLGQAGDLARPGDVINVRPGRDATDVYWEPDKTRGKVGQAVLAASVKGTATCAGGSRSGWGCTSDAHCPGSTCDFRPVVLRAYEPDGEPVRIDPGGKHPPDFGADQCWTRIGNFGRFIGLAIAGTGSCNPPDSGGVRNERLECYGGAEEGKPCTVLSDCGTGATACAARPWYWIVDGFDFTGWNYYDARLNRNNGNGTTTGNQCSEKALQITGPGYGGCPVPVSITIQNNRFLNNGGGGVLWGYQAAGMRYFNNTLLGSYTRGYTTVVNHWSPRDAQRNRRTYMWGNMIAGSYDDPPPWAHGGSTVDNGRKICRPADPANPPTLTCLGGDTPGAPCREETDCGWGHCGGLCAFDPYYNTAPANQGFNCECKTEWKDWDNDPIIPIDMCAPGLACVSQINTGGGGEPSGNTEGRGIIVDRGYTNAAIDFRNNVIFDNAGDCISVFLSDGGNAAMGPGVIANNTCYHNAKKGASFGELNISSRYLDLYNNLVVPLPRATCKSGPAGGRECTTYGKTGGICAAQSYGCTFGTNFQYDNIGLGSLNYAPGLPSSVRNGHDLFFLNVAGFLLDPIGFEYAPPGSGEVRNARFSAYVNYGRTRGYLRGTNSLAGDPLLASADPTSPHFLRVLPGSPALRAGNAAFAPPFDRDGNPRDPVAPTIGAYELPAGDAPPTTTTTAPAATTTTTSAPTSSTTTTTSSTIIATTSTTTTTSSTITTTTSTTTTTMPIDPGGTAWFGSKTVGGESSVNTADSKRASRFALSEDGLVNRLVVRLASSSGGSQRIRPVIYRDAAGVAGGLAAVGPERTVTPATTGEWIALPFSTPVPLAAGTYWLGTITGPDSKATIYFLGTTGGAWAYGWDPYADGPTDPAGAMSSSLRPMSIYAEYERPGAVTTTSLPTTTTTAPPSTTTTTTTSTTTTSTEPDPTTTSTSSTTSTTETPPESTTTTTEPAPITTSTTSTTSTTETPPESTTTTTEPEPTTTSTSSTTSTTETPTESTTTTVTPSTTTTTTTLIKKSRLGSPCKNLPDGTNLANVDTPASSSFAAGVRRLDVLRARTGWMVRGRARFQIPRGQDLSATGLTIALADANGESLLETVVDGSDLTRTKTGWRLTRARADIKRLLVNVSGESARVEIRAMVAAVPPRSDAEKTQTDGGLVYWEMQFGAACGGTGWVDCGSSASTSRKCRVY